jgi:hypothetical protein
MKKLKLSAVTAAFLMASTVHAEEMTPSTIVGTGGSEQANIPMELSAWKKTNCGNLEKTSEGVKFYGNNYRSRSDLYSNSWYDFTNAEVFYKWKANGQASFMWVVISTGSPSIARWGSFSTAWSYAGSVPLADETWYYTHVRFSGNKSETSTSTGDYDINGGKVIRSDIVDLTDAQLQKLKKSNVSFYLADNYGANATYMVVAEVKTTARPVEINWQHPVSYSFENDTMVPSDFIHSGDWSVDSTTGFNSSRSLFLKSNKNSTLSLNLPDNAVAVSFKYRVLIEDAWDSFYSKLDDVWGITESRDKTGCWSESTFVIPNEGMHTVNWKYGEETNYSGQSQGSPVWLDDVTVYIAPVNNYAVYGLLLGRTGKRLAGATIHLGGDKTAITAADGTWSINGLSPDKYEIVATKANESCLVSEVEILDNGQYQQKVNYACDLVTYGDSNASVIAIYQYVNGNLQYVDTVTVEAFDAKFQEGRDYKIADGAGEYVLEGIDDAGNTTSKVNVVRIQ